MIEFIKVLFGSLGENIIIIVFAVAEAIIAAFIKIFNDGYYKKIFKSGQEKNNIDFNYKLVDILYSLFVTIISIFPLLGMLGTVASLVTLDMSGDMSVVQDKFFLALTSTAWGIVFAIVFKIVNAVIQTKTEDNLEKAKRALENSKEE